MPDPVHLIPLDAIDDTALTRDRTALDPEALQELISSIAVSGLRMPIELFHIEAPDGPKLYGLISGSRRLAAFRSLHATALDKEKFAAIPAFLREPRSVVEVFKAMVEENAIRADTSPWEQAMVAVTARDQGVFETIDAAVDALYANLTRDKRRRLRTAAYLAEELDGHLTAPETLSLRQVLRLAAAFGRGFGELMRYALGESRQTRPEEQWQLLLPILMESEHPDTVEPRPIHTDPRQRARRLLIPRHGLTVRRSMTRDGWCLHFTGRNAHGPLLDAVLDDIERAYSPA